MGATTAGKLVLLLISCPLCLPRRSPDTHTSLCGGRVLGCGCCGCCDCCCAFACVGALAGAVSTDSPPPGMGAGASSQKEARSRLAYWPRRLRFTRSPRLSASPVDAAGREAVEGALSGVCGGADLRVVRPSRSSAALLSAICVNTPLTCASSCTGRPCVVDPLRRRSRQELNLRNTTHGVCYFLSRACVVHVSDLSVWFCVRVKEKHTTFAS